MTEQVIETDSMVVEGSGAVQVWCTWSNGGVVPHSDLLGLSSPLVKWWWCTQTGSGWGTCTLVWEHQFGLHQLTRAALIGMDVFKSLLQLQICNERSSSSFSSSEEFYSYIILPVWILEVIVPFWGAWRHHGCNTPRCYCDLPIPCEKLSQNWHSWAFKYCMKICEP